MFASIAVANGNISPCRFVKIDTTSTAPNRVIQCVGSDAPFGISAKGTRRVPIDGLDDGFAAIAGEGLQVYQLAETAQILLGATVTAGDRLTSDSNGMGITATTGQYYGAIAELSGIAGQVIDVLVQTGTM